MADRRLDALQRRAFACRPILDQEATRAGLESALVGARGVALFAHGRRAEIGTNKGGGVAGMADDAIAGWCADHPDEAGALGIEATAQQLVYRLIYQPASESESL